MTGEMGPKTGLRPERDLHGKGISREGAVPWVDGRSL